jgi:hypothetical protein
MKNTYTFTTINKRNAPKSVKATSFDEAEEKYWEKVNCPEYEWTLRITNTATGEYKDFEYCEG